MATTMPVPLTRPRLSALVLEGTATVVSLTLALWLLFWFAGRKPHEDRIAAYYVTARGGSLPVEEVPFQAAEARRLRRLSPSAEVRPTPPNELVPEVRQLIRSGAQPLVIYVSLPVVRPDDWQPVQQLIETIAQDARRAVLLVVDLAQIDTDRELGVFGNSPHSAIAQTLRELKQPAAPFWILTSSAPAQKSWSADGLGESICAHYLLEGLEGKAKDWDAAEPGKVTVVGLHAFVLARVKRWAALCRESVQTPTLWPVSPAGSKPVNFSLREFRPVSRPQTARAERPVQARPEAPDSVKRQADPPGKSAGAAELATTERPQEGAGTDGYQASWNKLLEEWRWHDELRKEKPYRYLPGSWRSYEAALLRAERSLRIAVHDASWDAGPALQALATQRIELTEELKLRVAEARAFPFRAVANDAEGKRQLAEALEYLKDPTGSPEKAGAGTGANKDGARAPRPLPAAFAAPQSEPPRTYLELQLPTWAYRFTDVFKRPDYFTNPARSELLVRLVSLRGDAEAALATDQRGLFLIKDSIERGDELRRQVQDSLFAVTGDGGTIVREADPVLEDVGRHYRLARAAIGAFGTARDAWEDAFDALPYYGEWAVRKAAIGAGKAAQGLPSSPLPPSVERVLGALDALTAALNAPLAEGQVDDGTVRKAIDERRRELSDAADATKEAMSALERDFEKEAGPSSVKRGSWVELDAALRVPLVPCSQRKIYLDRILQLDDRVDDCAEKTREAPAAPADPGFWTRAAGLARLELALRRLSQRSQEAPSGDRATIEDAWTKVLQARDDASLSPMDLFTPINERVSRLRELARTQLSKAVATDARRELGPIEKELQSRDASSRGLSATEADAIGPDADHPARDYRRLVACACLEFHVARLDKDYVADLSALIEMVQSRRKQLGLLDFTFPVAAGERLKVVVAPDPPKPIGQDWKSEFTVNVQESSGSASDDRRMPPGSVYLGVTGVARGLTLNGLSPGDDLPGRLVEVPLDGVTSPSLRFHVEQKGPVKLPEEQTSLALTATLFYRGRHNLAKPAVVAVEPRNVPESIAFSISQNPEKLRVKYPGAGEIADQFARDRELHPGKRREGFLHRGNDLDFVVKIENKTPGTLKVRYRRAVVEDPKKIAEEPWLPVEELRPGEPKTIYDDRILSARVRNGQTQTFVAEVKAVSPADPATQDSSFSVAFREVSFKEAFEITGSPKPKYRIKKEGRVLVKDAFVVRLIRREDDPVTEPIPREKLTVDFLKGMEPIDHISALEEEKPYLLPGQPIDFYVFGSDFNGLKWIANIEDYRIEDGAEK